MERTQPEEAAAARARRAQEADREVRFLYALERNLRAPQTEEKLFHLALQEVAAFLRATAGALYLWPGLDPSARRPAAVRGPFPLDRGDLPVPGRYEGEERPAGFAATALREDRDVVGEIVLWRAAGDFVWSERESLRRAGDTLSHALGERRRARREEVEARIQRKLLGELRPKDIYYQVLDGLRSLVGYNVRGTLFIHDPERRRMVARAEKIAWRRGKSSDVGRVVAWEEPQRGVFQQGGALLLRREGDRWSCTGCAAPPGTVEPLLPPAEAGEPAPRALLAAPLREGEATVGLLALWGDDAHRFDIRHLAPLARMADLAAVAVQRASETDKRHRELEAIRSIGEVASRPIARRELGEHILRCALDVLGVSTGAIDLVDEEAGVLRTLCEIGRDTTAMPALRVGEGITGRVAASGESYLAHDVLEHPAYVSRAPGTRSELAVPLRYRDRTIGVLNLESSVPGRFDASDVRFLTILAAQAASALKTTEFYRELQDRIEQGRDRMRLLQRMAMVLGEMVESDALPEAVAHETRRWLRSEEAAVLWLRDGALHLAAASRREQPASGEAVPAAEWDALALGAVDPPDRPPFGRVVRQSVPSLVPGGPPRGHLLAVPLRAGDRVLGVLRVLNRVGADGQLALEGFESEEEETLLSIAGQVSVALSARLRQRRLLLLHQVETAFRGERDVDAAATRVTEALCGPLGGHRAAVVRLANQHQELEVRGACPAGVADMPHPTLERGEGVAGRAYREGAALHVPDVTAEPDFVSVEWARSHGLVSLYCLPLQSASGTIGTLEVYGSDEGGFPEEERRTLDTVAQHTALAVENLRLYADLEALRQATETQLSAGELDEMLLSVMEEGASAVGADPVVLYVYDAARGEFERPTMVVGQVRHQSALWEPVGEGHAASRVLRGGAPLFLEDVSSEPPESFVVREGIASAARIPLLAGGEPLGVLFFNFRHPRSFTPRLKGLMESFAAALALAIRTAKRVEARTRQVERFAAYVHSAPVGICEVDASGVAVFANRSAAEMLRARQKYRLGEGPDGGAPPFFRPGELEDLLREAFGVGFAAREFMDRGDEPGSSLLLTCTPLAPGTDGGERFLVLARDTTELRRLQQRATLAELARGVAHDVNNALGAVLPLLAAVREDLSGGQADPAALQQDLEEIDRYVQSCRRIFLGMVRASREKGFRRQPVNVNEIIQTTVELIRGRLAKAGIQVVSELASDLPPVSASPSALEQVFLNLADNAAHAMPEGGTLRFRTVPENEGVAVTVEDSGVGIPAEDLARVFEPFYTTRPGSTGLGLSSSRALAWGFGGKMDLTSEAGKGTVVRVWFPRAEGEDDGDDVE